MRAFPLPLQVDPNKRPSFIQVLDVLTTVLDEGPLDRGQQCSKGCETPRNLKDSGFEETLCVLKKVTSANCSSSDDSVLYTSVNAPLIPPKVILQSQERHRIRSYPGATTTQSPIPTL